MILLASAPVFVVLPKVSSRFAFDAYCEIPRMITYRKLWPIILATPEHHCRTFAMDEKARIFSLTEVAST